MASQTGIPIIAWNADNAGFTFNKPLSEYNVIQLAPPIEHQIKAMFAILKRYNWEKFAVVTSKMAGSEKFLHLIQERIRLEGDVRSYKFQMMHHTQIDESLSLEEIKNALIELKNAQVRIILLYSTMNRARKIFSVAKDVGLMESQYLWIGTQSVKGSLSSAHDGFQLGMLSVNFHTVSNAMFPPVDDILSMIVGIAPKLFGVSLQKSKIASNVSFVSPVTCDSVDGSPGLSWDTGKTLYQNMLNSYVKGNPYHIKDGYDNFFYTFKPNGQLAQSQLTVSNFRSKQTANGEVYSWEKVGEFKNELKMADIEWPGRRANPPLGLAEKFHLKVVTLEESPFIIVSDLDEDTNECPGSQGIKCQWGESLVKSEDGTMTNKTDYKCLTGFCVDLLKKLAADIGFTYSIYRVQDAKWGIKTDAGWNGLPAELINGHADMIVAPLKLNSERARDIDFSVPFMDTGISIIVKIRSGVLSATAFLEPFEYSTWAIIFFLAIQLSAFAIFGFEWVSPYSFNMGRYPPPGHRFSLCRSYWLVWATLFSASVSTDVPRSMVSRFMSLVWAAFGLTFLAVYTANLAAFMITRIQFHDLTGVEDYRLVDAADQSPVFTFGTVENGNTHETMKRNWRRLNEFVTNKKFFVENVAAGIDAVRNDKLNAFIYDAVVLDYLAGKDANCELMMVGKWASMTGYGIGFPKNSPHLKAVNKFLSQYAKDGYLERTQNFWITGACVRDGNGQSQSAPLGIENFLSAFMLLGAGIVVGIICLGFEYLYCNHLRRYVQKIDKGGWIGIVSMALGKSLSFEEAVVRVKEWKQRNRSLSSSASPSMALRSLQKRNITGKFDSLCLINCTRADDSAGTTFVFAYSVQEAQDVSYALITSVIIIPTVKNSECKFSYISNDDFAEHAYMTRATFNATNEYQFSSQSIYLSIATSREDTKGIDKDFRVFAFCTEEVKLIGRISDPVNAWGDLFEIQPIKNAGLNHIISFPPTNYETKFPGHILLLLPTDHPYIKVSVVVYNAFEVWTSDSYNLDTKISIDQSYLSAYIPNVGKNITITITSDFPILTSLVAGLATTSADLEFCGDTCKPNYVTYMPLPIDSQVCNQQFNQNDTRMITANFTSSVYVAPPVAKGTCNEQFQVAIFDDEHMTTGYYETVAPDNLKTVDVTGQNQIAITSNVGPVAMYRFGSIVGADQVTAFGHFGHYIPSTNEWITEAIQFFVLDINCYLEVYTDKKGSDVSNMLLDNAKLVDFHKQGIEFFSNAYSQFIIKVSGYGLHTYQNPGKFIAYVVCKNVNGMYDSAGYLTGFNKMKV
uniref:Glutamate receptor n=1 Tax=Rhabditophanes sp. KR3021 TaxID=114890 RepID=A0AC35UDE0_9BILA